MTDLLISIHAPAWGATRTSKRLRLTRRNFNPRTRVGCDAYLDRLTYNRLRFQSTHPRGVRPTRSSRF